jgi:FG-GAP-like repeat
MAVGTSHFQGVWLQGRLFRTSHWRISTNDGIPDLVFMISPANTAPNTFLSLGNGNGTFQTVSTLLLTTQNPDGIAVADVNKDGLLDIIVDDNGAPGTPSGSIQIALQRPGGSFVHVGTLGQFNPTGVIAVDLDGDGNVDIGATGTINGQDLFNMFRGRGDGSFFAPAQFPVPAGVLHPIAAHLTDTVAFDAITSGISANQISVLVNHGANTLRHRR